jgi:hypothetical protein
MSFPLRLLHVESLFAPPPRISGVEFIVIGILIIEKWKCYIIFWQGVGEVFEILYYFEYL